MIVKNKSGQKLIGEFIFDVFFSSDGKKYPESEIVSEVFVVNGMDLEVPLQWVI